MRKADYKPLIVWESDGTNSIEWLSVLLRPSLGLKLLPGPSGSMPKPKGAASRREYAVAISTGPYANREGERDLDDPERVPCLHSSSVGGCRCSRESASTA